jgi:predicted GIY-YIG superfamily endonuclease
MGNSDERAALYRFYEAGGQLLYVGITSKPGERWEAHTRSQPWWPEVARQTMEWHTDRTSALDAERTAIRQERPLYNARHSIGLSTLTLKTTWTCPACQWKTTDPVEQVEHMEQEVRGLAAGPAPREDVERLARIVERTSNALDRAEASLARAHALFSQAANGAQPRRESRPIKKAEVHKLLDDLGQILGSERVRLSELPVLLRQHDPDWLPYRKMTGTDLHAVLRKHGIRVTNTGNVRRLDPADLVSRSA